MTLEHPALEPYTPDGFTTALQDAIGELGAGARRCCRTPIRRGISRRSSPRGWIAPLLTDVTAVKSSARDAVFVRPMFQGKLTADVVPRRPRAALRDVPDRRVSRGSGAARASRRAGADALPSTIDASAIRQKPEAPFQQAQAGRRPVAGRAHRRRSAAASRNRTNIPVAQKLAQAHRRRARGVAADLRRRLAADGASGRQLGSDRRAEAVSGARASQARFSTSSG